MGIIALLVFAIVTAADVFLFNQDLKDRYKHWYKPWLLTIFFLLALIPATKLIDWLKLIIHWDIVYLEVLFCAVIGAIWLLIKFLLKKFAVDDKIMNRLEGGKEGASEANDKESGNHLFWPYYMVPPGNIFLKAMIGCQTKFSADNFRPFEFIFLYRLYHIQHII